MFCSDLTSVFILNQFHQQQQHKVRAVVRMTRFLSQVLHFDQVYLQLSTACNYGAKDNAIRLETTKDPEAV